MPNGPVDAGAATVNGYKPETWGKLQEKTGAPCKPFSWDDAREIYGLLSGETVLGAATHFDVAFLREAFRRVRHPFPNISHRFVDVHSLAIPLVAAGKIERVSLECLCQFYGLGSVEHSAASDVSKTITVFERLCLDLLPAAQAATGGVQ
jgi:DNA polymerase III epsilon subunit-like protein